MDLRLPLQTTFQRALTDTQRITAQLLRLQAQAASGKKLQRVSEDPHSSLAALSHEARANRLETHLANVQAVRSNLNISVSTLQEALGVFAQARTIGLEGASSVNDARVRDTLAQQVDSLLDRFLRLANTRNHDTYIFAGNDGSDAPFEISQRDTLGRIQEIRYVGTTLGASAVVSDSVPVEMLYPGNEVFLRRERQATRFLGNTGAVAGTGTDSATARGTLLIQHTATTFALGSGVIPGAGSSAGDTILGPAGAHQLTVNDTSGTGAAGTVSLDGGLAFAFTNADGNLRVTNAQGDAVFLDTTAITPGFVGSVAITSTGAMSVDGGLSFVPLTFAADQSVRHNVTGAVTFVNTSNVRRTGVEHLEYAGAYDAFQALLALRDDLRNTRGLSEREQNESISRQVAELERVANHVSVTLGAQSSSLHSLQALETQTESLRLASVTAESEIQEVDLSEVVIKLQQFQQQLQLALATFSRIGSQSLLDYLQ